MMSRVINLGMIRSFRSGEAEVLLPNVGPNKLLRELWRTAHRGLLSLDIAARLEELSRAWGVRLEHEAELLFGSVTAEKGTGR